ncbi:hypothetical protein KR215_005699 [Drosophila sulfurigaster]|nr:hypothetical protein KR215_005699 [Drosophila sulfurigaster]
MNYLYLLACCLALISCSSAAAFGKPTGQPGCQTEEEIAVQFYPHFYIKNQYWVCSTLGVPATVGYCPIATAFLNDAKACVPWAEWYWSPPVLPPSEPLSAAI